MHRYRRLVLIDRLIPFLAAGVGLVALLGAVTVQLNAEADRRVLDERSAEASAAVEKLASLMGGANGRVPADPAVADAVSALTSRVAQLETDLAAARATLAAATTALAAAEPGASPAPLTFTASADGATPPADTEAAAASSDAAPEGTPTTDCIPLGTRFMATPNESYPICKSKTVLKVGAITGDTVEVVGAGPVVETGFANLVGTSCTVMVFSADAEGFAELRLTCA